MPHLLKNFLLLALFLGAATLTPTLANSTGSVVLPYKLPLAGGELTVTFPSSGTADMSWTPISGGGLVYLVEIYDLSAMQPVTSFYTGNTYATVSNLPIGHLCRFSVSKGNEIIIIDDVMTGG